jgi:polycystin 1L2
MRVWHDNSGKNDMASWFLKYIIVYDLQTREKFYFLCQKWLAIEKDDGKIERELFVACDKQKTELGFLMQKNVNHHMRDSHLWYSVFARPVQSSFTRLDRVTCCFVLLYTTMLMSIIYYDASDSNVSSSQFISNKMVIGPFGLMLTLEQVNFQKWF